MQLFDRLLDPRLLRFAAVGGSGVVVNLGILWLLADNLHVDYREAQVVAIELSIIWNFFLNNAWTFRDRNEGARVGIVARLGRYNLVSLIGAGVQYGVFVMLTEAAKKMFARSEPGLWKYPSTLAGIGVAMTINFFTNFFWTWAQAEEKRAAR